MYHGWQHLSHEDERKIEEGVLSGEAKAGPFHLELQPTNNCNARCTFCCTTHFRHGEELDWNQLERVLHDEAARDLHYIRLIGGGDPLLYRNIRGLLSLLGSIPLNGFDLTTNGIVLEQHAELALASGCDEVHVSLNEPTPELYAATMRNSPANFQRVLSGIKRVAQLRDSVKPGDRRTRLVVQFFVDINNWTEIERMYGLGVELGADVVDIRTPFDPPSGFEVQRLSGDDLRAFGDRLMALVEADGVLEVPKLRLSLYGYPELNHEVFNAQRRLRPRPEFQTVTFDDNEPRKEYCYMPWYSSTIAASGRVFACCIHTELPGKALGSVGTDGFQPVWNGQGYRSLRKQMREVMLLRGNLRYSPKRHTCLIGGCVSRFGCNISFQLASEPFYDRMRQRMDDEFPGSDRLAAQTMDLAVRGVHTARSVARDIASRVRA